MEFLILILPIMIFIFFGGRQFLQPYLNGTKQIDRLERPTLYRIQRHFYVSNPKQREIESGHRLAAIEAASNREVDSINAHSQKLLDEKRDKHSTEIYKFDTAFADITRERDEQARREAEAKAREIRKREEAIRTQLREKELAVWTANEKARIERFKAEQEALRRQEDERVASLLQSRENDIQALRKYYVPDHQNQRFGYRIVNVHGLYVRKLPVKASRMLDNLTTHSMVSVNGWIQGEELFGNPIWFKLANDLGWIWSGGVDNKSTSGLVNYNYMNEPGDSFTSKSADGTVHQTYTAPSEMKTLIDAEILALEKERQAIESIKNTTMTFSAGMITADKLYIDKMKASADYDTY